MPGGVSDYEIIGAPCFHYKSLKTSQKHRGLKKKFLFAKKHSTTPENTVVVAPNNPEVNFVAIYIRL